MLIAPSAYAAEDCSTGCTQEARSASSFTNSVGVNTHVGYNDTIYNNFPLLRDRLVELGVKHVRDGTYRDGTRLNDVVPRFNELASLGIRGNLLSGDPSRRYGSGTIEEHLTWTKKNVPNFVESLEGPNEYDYPSVDPNWAANLRAYQCEWARQIRGDSVLAGRPIIAPSFTKFTSSGEMGDLTACLDRGNLHPYPGGLSPDRNNQGDLSASIENIRPTSGYKPIWVTESGYHNAINCSGCGHHPTSEKAAGVYIPRLFMENFRRGIERTYSYEMLDLFPDTGSVEPEYNFGLVHNDGSRKPAFVGLRNLLTILGDEQNASGKLSYSLQCSDCKEPLRQVLLRKSTGDYFLVIWPESSVWNREGRTDINNPARLVNLGLSSSSKLEVFDPAKSTSPISTTQGSSMGLSLNDGLSIVKISPSSQIPPSSKVKHPAKLEMARSRILRSQRKLDALAPISKRASGEAQVDLHAAGRHTRFSTPVNSKEGYIRFQKSIPRSQAKLGTGIVTLSYAGNEQTRGQEVRLRAASGKALLAMGRPTLAAGRLRAKGSISKRARGVVRLQLDWTSKGVSHSREYQARIRDGKWELDGKLSLETLQQIASRDDTLHSTTSFTGYFPSRIRGEMKSYQVLPAP
jgi:hypothetical protein